MPAPAPNPPPPAPTASLIQECPDLAQPTDDRWATLIENHDAVAGQYHDCRSGAARLVQATREWERTAWRWYCEALERIGAPEAGCTGDRRSGQGSSR